MNNLFSWRTLRIVCVIHATIAGILTLDLASRQQPGREVFLGMTFTVLFALAAVVLYLEEYDVR